MVKFILRGQHAGETVAFNSLDNVIDAISSIELSEWQLFVDVLSVTPQEMFEITRQKPCQYLHIMPPSDWFKLVRSKDMQQANWIDELEHIPLSSAYGTEGGDYHTLCLIAAAHLANPVSYFKPCTLHTLYT